MSRSMDLHNHYLNSRFPDEIPENLIEFFQDDDGLSYEEALLQQVIQIQNQNRNQNQDQKL